MSFCIRISGYHLHLHGWFRSRFDTKILIILKFNMINLIKQHYTASARKEDMVTIRLQND